MKSSNILWHINPSNIFPQVGSNDMMRLFSKDCLSLFLWTELHFVLSILRETYHFQNRIWKQILTLVRLSLFIVLAFVYWSYHIHGLYLDKMFFIIFAILALVAGIDESILVVFILSVAWIPLALLTKVHC